MCKGRLTNTSGLFGAFLLFSLLVPICEAQFKVSDNFTRPDGPVGLGWSAWGNGAQISGNQIATFGQLSVAGGIQRTLDVTFPLTFSFRFRTNVPSDGGWLIGFNCQAPGVVVADNTSEVEFRMYQGSGSVYTAFQTVSGPSFQQVGPVNGQRDFTALADISGTVRPDFSATITIKYNDGLLPDSVTIETLAPVDAIQNPVGSIIYFGNANLSFGPHFFGNFEVDLM